MIDLKVNVESMDNKTGEAEVKVSLGMGGTGEELVHEAVSAIRSLMNHLKEQDILLHMVVLRQIENDPSILFGTGFEEDFDEGKAKVELAAHMSKNIIKKGVN